MILNQAQAEAVYGAMVALNNVGASIDKISLPAAYYTIDVISYYDQITIRQGLKNCETYESQDAFAAAYGLQQG